ncbi:LacI family DNA-binding transcriptional regulator [Cognatishimia activa]|uniref:LacI family DNA-binding transcriptional regulator n=1 Tax=Cognatishimia activa TaxID=1715691 RepID=UPI002230DB1A|nr:LacI family DNA-binding transcriptional regulator [Cognatishimia activa]UZD90389.1 LacI family transcriptional regulator [Cognatishimia activa]
MARKPKLETVAKEAGVSVATASQVIRGTGRISEKTRKKVLEAAQKLHYVPDSRAASMRSGDNREIGFTIHQIANPFNAEVISGVSDLLENEGYLVSVLDSQDDPERQRRQLEAFIRSSRGGLLWVPAHDTPQSSIDLLRNHQMPTVTFLRREGTSDFDHVGILNTEATKTATTYLADLGHHNIAFLGGKADVDVRNQRIAGYKSVIAERNLGPEIIWDSADDKLAGLNAMMDLRLAHPEVTAIVCNGDQIALGACLALARNGEEPGKDVSIVGFDDIQDAAAATPPLTTMATSPYQLGRRLARALLERIRNPDSPIAISEISAKLVERETTGARSERVKKPR